MIYVLRLSQAVRPRFVPFPFSAKRLFDMGVALALLALALPLMGLVAAALKLQGGPVFFSQRRVGAGGAAFRMWKFRSMCSGAEAELTGLLERDQNAAASWAADAKLQADPRITRLGHYLRRYSLDELPQLWNVLNGEMSLVGPRPVPEAELAARYGGAAVAYKAGRPGLTGLWQVSGRNALSYQSRIALDLAYRRQQSLWFDLKIIARTGAAVLGGTGR